MLVSGQWVREKIKGQIKKLLETNEGNNTAYQNLQGTIKSMLKGKFISVIAYVKNQQSTKCMN